MFKLLMKNRFLLLPSVKKERFIACGYFDFTIASIVS